MSPFHGLLTDDSNLSPSMTELVIDADTRIQIVDNIPSLGRARKHQYAAFVRSEEVLCVWADHVESVMPAAEALEEALIRFIWRDEHEVRKLNQQMDLDSDIQKEAGADDNVSIKEGDPEDVITRAMQKHWKERPVMLLAPCSDGVAIILCMIIIGLGVRKFHPGPYTSIGAHDRHVDQRVDIGRWHSALCSSDLRFSSVLHRLVCVLVRGRLSGECILGLQRNTIVNASFKSSDRYASATASRNIFPG